VRLVAEKLADVNAAVDAMPPSQRAVVVELAEILRATSLSLGRAAQLGAQTAHRLHSLANSQVNKVDDADPLKSVEELKGVSALTRLANDSASIAISLLAANKERLRETPGDEAPAGLDHFYAQQPG